MATSEVAFAEMFRGVPVMAILRGKGVDESVRLAVTAWDLGIRAVEVTLQSPEDVDALKAVVRAGRERDLPVGAGTILTVAGVDDAVAAGAAFTVSPGLDLAVVRASEQAGLPSLPGVSTPTEVHQARAAGLHWLKAFPATALGPAWFTAMSGPFPDITFIATGGITSENAHAYLEAGVRVVAVGSALANREELPRLADLLAA